MIGYIEIVGEVVEKMVTIATDHGVYSQFVNREFNIASMKNIPSLCAFAPQMVEYLAWILGRNKERYQCHYRLIFTGYQATSIEYGGEEYIIEDIDRLTGTRVVIRGNECIDEIVCAEVIGILNSI